MALGLTACGGETEPSLGNAAVVTTTTTIATTTVPVETTTTIDFDREPSQETTPLPEDATAAELAEVVDNMRGPTNDASEQLQRIATFLDLASPAQAQIMELSIATEPAEDDRVDISTQVRMRTPQTVADLAVFYDGELRSAGWNKAGFSETTVDGLPATELVFRIPGTSGSDTELGITLSNGPVTFIDLDLKLLSEEDDESFERLLAWQSAIRTPRTTNAAKAVVFTAGDSASLQVIYTMEADSAAEAREDIAELVRTSEFTIDSPDESGTSTAPLLLVDEDGQEYLLEFAPTRDPEIFWMMVSASFDLEPIDPEPEN